MSTRRAWATRQASAPADPAPIDPAHLAHFYAACQAACVDPVDVMDLRGAIDAISTLSIPDAVPLVLAYAGKAPDPRPGFYYVTCRDGGGFARGCGPYTHHADALADVARVRKEVERLDPRAAFWSWGTCRVRENLGPGMIPRVSA